MCDATKKCQLNLKFITLIFYDNILIFFIACEICMLINNFVTSNSHTHTYTHLILIIYIIVYIIQIIVYIIIYIYILFHFIYYF